jgi:hypothetical protein
LVDGLGHTACNRPLARFEQSRPRTGLVGKVGAQGLLAQLAAGCWRSSVCGGGLVETAILALHAVHGHWQIRPLPVHDISFAVGVSRAVLMPPQHPCNKHGSVHKDFAVPDDLGKTTCIGLDDRPKFGW